MKFVFVFAGTGVLLAVYAVVRGGFAWLLLWPAGSFALVGLGYFRLGPRVFGKRPNGEMAPFPVLVLLPYLLCLWAVWHVARLAKRENAYDELVPGILIGRRLLAGELPPGVDVVVDLTCEFAEPYAIRSQGKYVCLPILDASVPPPESFLGLVEQLAGERGTLYIHCAEGHGRTGLVAAGLVLEKGLAPTPRDAMQYVQSRRPNVRLDPRQMRALDAFGGERHGRLA